jgi:hypothetical protein
MINIGAIDRYTLNVKNIITSISEQITEDKLIDENIEIRYSKMWCHRDAHPLPLKNFYYFLSPHPWYY